jgi:hypothetical protein
VAFLKDVDLKPTPKYTIDRINVNGDYEPGNVRWATRQQQSDNTRRVHPVTIHGRPFPTLSAAARYMGLERKTLYYRLKHGTAF